MSAREEAWKAATAVAEKELTHQRWESLGDSEFVRPFADAASDVWEPIVVRLLLLLEATSEAANLSVEWDVKGAVSALGGWPRVYELARTLP